MDFLPNEQQKMIVETARRVGAEYGLDYWREIDARKEFPAELWKAICSSGRAAAASACWNWR